MIRSALQALRSTKAVSAAEYAILAVGVVVVVGGAAAAFKKPLEDAFATIGTKIGTVANSAGTSTP